MMEEIIIKAYKYENKLHYKWKSNLIEKTDKYIIGRARPGRVLHHYTRDNKFVMDNWSIEFFLKDYWFNVMVDIKKGDIVQYYCNVAKPPKITENNIISFVDLDFDLVKKNGEWSVLDEDDFKKNQKKYDYSKELIQKAKVKLEELKKRIENNKFPFNGFIRSNVSEISENIEE